MGYNSHSVCRQVGHGTCWTTKIHKSGMFEPYTWNGLWWTDLYIRCLFQDVTASMRKLYRIELCWTIQRECFSTTRTGNTNKKKWTFHFSRLLGELTNQTLVFPWQFQCLRFDTSQLCFRWGIKSKSGFCNFVISFRTSLHVFFSCLFWRWRPRSTAISILGSVQILFWVFLQVSTHTHTHTYTHAHLCEILLACCCSVSFVLFLQRFVWSFSQHEQGPTEGQRKNSLQQRSDCNFGKG